MKETEKESIKRITNGGLQMEENEYFIHKNETKDGIEFLKNKGE